MGAPTRAEITIKIHPKNSTRMHKSDGLVLDPQEESSAQGVVEYKNPYNAREMTISEAIKKVKDLCLVEDENGHTTLKKSHPYYYQVQATMFCMKRNWCDFVVNTTQDLHIEYDLTNNFG